MNPPNHTAAGDPGAPPPLKPSLLRRLFRWRVWRVIIFLAVALATLLFLLNTEENWRAHRAWKQCRAKLEARGERLDLAAFIPAPVPVEQNFAAIPLLSNALAHTPAPNPINIHLNRSKKTPDAGSWRAGRPADLEAWRQYLGQGTNYPVPPQSRGAAADVLFALSKFEPAFAELRAGAQRPLAQYPVNWLQDPLALNIPHLALNKGLVQALNLRAVAFLGAGQPQDALDDLRVSFKLVQALKEEPVLISYLVRIAMVDLAVQPIYEGLAGRRWTEAQLAALEAELAKLDFLADGLRVLRGERAFGIVVADQLMRSREQARKAVGMMDTVPGMKKEWPLFIRLTFPCWLIWRSQVLGSECQQDIIDGLQRAAEKPGAPLLLEPALTNVWHARFAKPTMYNALARQLVPVMFRAPPQICRGQTVVNLARVACALERYRLAHSQYPDILEALAPKFLERLPSDPYAGQPFRYRREPEGRFILYSVGANLVDDGGVRVLKDSGQPYPERGDLVWAYP